MRTDKEIHADIQGMFEGILSNIELQADVDFVTDVEGYSDEEKERFEELLQNYELTYRRY